LVSLDGKVDLILDGGPTETGLESTIVAVRKDGTLEELRPGPISFPRETRQSADYSRKVEAPGQIASHYAPGKPVRLDAALPQSGEFMIGFGDISGDANLSFSGDLNEAASRLYACLHQGAASAQPRMAVAPIPDEGIGRAINDRLRRAATPPDGRRD
jgi:L-threonylcarbamoyladenylate synthase